MTAKKEEDFDWEVNLSDLQIPNMLKAGVKQYIISQNKTPKNPKDLEKTVDEYLNLKVGD